MKERGRPQDWPPRWPDVTDPAVLQALATVPRHRFMPAELRDLAYDDAAQPIGHGQTISQPYIVALMTQALRLTPQSRVLEIGTGSGYQAAILASLTPNVWSIEARPELAASAMTRLAELGYRVEIKCGNGCLGWPEQAPFDAIIVTAAGHEVPPTLVDQLAEGGRLVMPIGSCASDQRLWLIEKCKGEGPSPAELCARVLAEVRFVPLVSPSSAHLSEDERLAGIRRQLRDLLDPWRN